MKIMFNCLNMNKGGAERVISVLSNNFIKKHEVAILTLRNEKYNYKLNEKIKKINVSTSPKNKFFRKMSKLSIISLLKLNKLIKKENPDIIISFLSEPSLKLMLLKKIDSKIKKIPVIVSIRNDPNIEFKNPIINSIMKYLYKDVDGLVLQTEKTREYFEKNLRKVKNSVVIFNPVDDSFIFDKPFDGVRKKEIVSVGRLEHSKNHFLLINSFIDFHKNNKDYMLKIYGEGSLMESLEKYIKKNNAQKYIKLMGKTDNIKQICNATCFVLSSNYEGMPNCLIEAMCMGIPCISTKVSGATDLIEDNVNGLLVDINNKIQMINQMEKICNDKKLQNFISKNAIKILKYLKSDIIANQWIEYINKVVEEFKNEKK